MKLFVTTLFAALSAASFADVAPAAAARNALTGAQTLTHVRSIVNGGAAAVSAEQALVGAIGAEQTATLLGAVQALKLNRGFGAQATDWTALESAASKISGRTVVENLISMNGTGANVSPEFYGAALMAGEVNTLAATLSGATPDDVYAFCETNVGPAAAKCSGLRAALQKGTQSARTAAANVARVIQAGLANLNKAAVPATAAVAIFMGTANWADAGYASKPSAVEFAANRVATAFAGEEGVSAPLEDYFGGLGNAAQICKVNNGLPVCNCVDGTSTN